MRVDDRMGVFEDIVTLGPQHADTLRTIRAAVHARNPDGVEVASLGERSVWWSVRGGKMTDGYAYAMPHARYVNLGFFRGVSLPDPARRLEGTGKMLRHVKLKDRAAAEDPDVLALLDAAIAERRAAMKEA